MRQRKFYFLLNFYFIYFLSFSYRSEDVTIETYDESDFPIPRNHSILFNSMIYPFTRIVIYGVAWDQGKQLDFTLL
jgi:hypothetical protein